MLNMIAFMNEGLWSWPRRGKLSFFFYFSANQKNIPFWSCQRDRRKRGFYKVQSNSSTLLLSTSGWFLVAAQIWYDVPTSFFILGQQWNRSKKRERARERNSMFSSQLPGILGKCSQDADARLTQVTSPPKKYGNTVFPRERAPRNACCIELT